MKPKTAFLLLIALLSIIISSPFDVQAEELKPNINIIVKVKNITQKDLDYSDTTIVQDGDIVEWIVTVENSGDATATNVILESILPDNTTFIEVFGAGITPKSSNPPSYSWQISDIPSGVTNYYYITAQLTGDCGLNKTFTSSVTWDLADSPVSKTADLTPAIVDLNITKTPLTTVAKQGDTVGWTINVKNEGTIIASNVEIVEELGDGFLAPSASPVPNISGSILTWSNITINPGETYTITVDADVNAAGDHTATTTATEYNSNKTAVISEDSAKAAVAIFDFGVTIDTATGDVNDAEADTFGEIMKFNINMNFNGNDSYKDIQFMYTLPHGIGYGDYLTPIPGISMTTSGKTTTISLPDITGAQTIDITFDAIIREEGTVGRGSLLTNLGKMSFDIDYGDGFTATFPNNLSSLQDQNSLTLKEPVAYLSQRTNFPDNDSAAEAGEELTTMLKITNNPSGDNNVSNAYECKVVETISVGARKYDPTTELVISKINESEVIVGTLTKDIDYATSFDSGTGKMVITFKNTMLGILQDKDCFEITYKTKVDDDIGANTPINLEAQLVGYYGQPSDSMDVKSYTDSNTFSVEYHTVESSHAMTAEKPSDKKIKPSNVVTYKASIVIPKGTSVYDVDIIANLPAGIEYIDSSSIGLNNGGSLYRDLTPVLSGTAEFGQTITWANEVANQDITNNTGSNLVLTLTFDALVLNSPSISNGNIITTNFIYNYNSIDNSSESRNINSPVTVDLVVSEPDLSVSMNVISSGPYEAGETVSYRLNINNTSDITAYDVKITDLLPEKLTLKSTPTFDSGSASFNQSGQELSLGLDNNLDILPDGNIIINIDAILDVEIEPEEVVKNDVTVTWSSVDGIDIKERHYSKTLASTADITVADTTALTKWIVGGNNFTIGEPITFWLKMNINEGTTERIVIKDILPEGMEFSSASIKKDNENISYVLNNEPVEGDTGELVWGLGTIVNPANSDDTDNVITVKYTAIIQDVVENVRGTWLTNTAYLEYTDGEDIIRTTSDTTGSVKIIEPELKLEAEITSTDPYEAGETVSYKVKIDNIGNATAYDVNITDLLPDKLTFKPESSSASFNQSGQELTWGSDNNLDILPGANIIINIDTVLDVEIEPEEVVKNNVTVSWSSVEGVDTNERTYTKTLASTIDITVADSTTLSRKVIGTPKFVIGETINYQLELTLNKGTTDNVVVKDTLPAGIEFVSGSISPDGSGAVQYTLSQQPSSGEKGEIIWNFGKVTVPESESNKIIIDYTIKVLNTAENQANNTKNLSAVMTYDNAVGTAKSTLPQEHSFVIKEPKLIVEKSFPVAVYNAGDIVTYTIKVWHPATTSPNNVSAYDVQIIETVPAGMSYVADSMSPSGSVHSNELKWIFNEVPLTNDIDNPLVLTYQVILNDSVQPAQQFDENVNVTWSSLAGDVVGERNGIGSINDYFTNDAATLIVNDATALTKGIVGGNKFPIGEPITFLLKMNINEGTTERIEIKDILPAGMEFCSASIEIDNENISYVLNNEPVKGETGEILWNLGTIVNPANADDTDNIITVKYTAIIQDVVENIRETSLTNTTAYLEYTDGEGNVHTTNDTTESIVIIEPELKLEAEITSIYPYAVGDTITHRITISHTGESNATAYDVKITDILPEGLRFDSYTADPNITVGPIKDGNNVVLGGSGNIDLNPGDSYTFNMNAVLDTQLEPEEQKNYNVKLDYSSSDGENAYERYYNSNLSSSVDISDEDKVSWVKKILKIIYAKGDSANRVTQDLTLPIKGGGGTTISWESSNEEYITAEGVATRPTSAVGDVNVTLTGSINLNETSDTKEFVLTVKAPQKKSTKKSKTKLEVKLDGEESKQIEEAVHVDTKVNTIGRKVTTLTFEGEKITRLISNLDTTGKKEIQISVKNNESNMVTAELNGQIVRNMELKDIEIKIVTERASYTLPAEEINIDEVKSKFAKNIELEDIKVNIEISEARKEEVKVIESEANDGNLAIIVKPMSFEVKATHNGKTIIVDKFKSYVKREVAIPEGTDPNKITTAVIEKDGKLVHVPTKVIVRNGKYYAEINSVTNSIYTLVWNEKNFDDVERHWSKDDVNDMASKLIIKGVEANRFEPDREITRAEFATVIIRALGLAESQGHVEFSDIGQEVWYKGAVKTAYEYGLIKGDGNGTFKPQDKITRQEAMAMIQRAMTITGLKAEASDKEIDELLSKYIDGKDIADWAKKAVAECVRSELVKGYEGKLTPTDYITRAETAVLVRRLLIDADLIDKSEFETNY